MRILFQTARLRDEVSTIHNMLADVAQQHQLTFLAQDAPPANLSAFLCAARLTNAAMWRNWLADSEATPTFDLAIILEPCGDPELLPPLAQMSDPALMQSEEARLLDQLQLQKRLRRVIVHKDVAALQKLLHRILASLGQEDSTQLFPVELTPPTMAPGAVKKVKVKKKSGLAKVAKATVKKTAVAASVISAKPDQENAVRKAPASSIRAKLSAKKLAMRKLRGR